MNNSKTCFISNDNHLLRKNSIVLPCDHAVCRECINEEILIFKCKCGNEFLTEEILCRPLSFSSFNLCLIEFEAKLNEYKDDFQMINDLISVKTEEVREAISLKISKIKSDLDEIYKEFSNELDERKKYFQKNHLKFHDPVPLELKFNEWKKLIKESDETIAKSDKSMQEIEIKLKKLNNLLHKQRKFETKIEFVDKSLNLEKSVLGEIKPEMMPELFRNHEDSVHEEAVINEIKLVYNPYNICSLPNNKLLVSDYINNQLLYYDENFQLIKTIKQIDGHSFCPLGISTDGNNKIYVCDHDNNRIILVDYNFKIKKMFGRKGSGTNELKHPYDAYYYSNQVFVCDLGNKRIQQLTSDLTFIKSFKLDYEPWQLVALNGKLFVRSYNEKAIYIYDINTWNSNNDHEGKIDGHNGILCKCGSHVYEFNTKYSKIYCYNQNGVLLNYIDLNLKNFYFYHLFGFTLLENKNIFVISAGEKFLTVRNKPNVELCGETWSF